MLFAVIRASETGTIVNDQALAQELERGYEPIVLPDRDCEGPILVRDASRTDEVMLQGVKCGASIFVSSTGSHDRADFHRQERAIFASKLHWL
jgi:hypothetical protein